jgi:hypothetical protein
MLKELILQLSIFKILCVKKEFENKKVGRDFSKKPWIVCRVSNSVHVNLFSGVTGLSLRCEIKLSGFLESLRGFFADLYCLIAVVE